MKMKKRKMMTMMMIRGTDPIDWWGGASENLQDSAGAASTDGSLSKYQGSGSAEVLEIEETAEGFQEPAKGLPEGRGPANGQPEKGALVAGF